MDMKIQPISMHHADSFHSCLDIVAREGKYIGSLKAPSIERIRTFVENNIKDNQIQLVVLEDDNVIGWIDILISDSEIDKHCGRLGMDILPEYRSQGLGKRLMQNALNMALANDIKQVRLEVYETNSNAIEFYKQFGFVVEGVKKKASLIQGEYVDNIVMAKYLPNSLKIES